MLAPPGPMILFATRNSIFASMKISYRLVIFLFYHRQVCTGDFYVKNVGIKSEEDEGLQEGEIFFKII